MSPRITQRRRPAAFFAMIAAVLAIALPQTTAIAEGENDHQLPCELHVELTGEKLYEYEWKHEWQKHKYKKMKLIPGEEGTPGVKEYKYKKQQKFPEVTETEYKYKKKVFDQVDEYRYKKYKGKKTKKKGEIKWGSSPVKVTDWLSGPPHGWKVDTPQQIGGYWYKYVQFDDRTVDGTSYTWETEWSSTHLDPPWQKTNESKVIVVEEARWDWTDPRRTSGWLLEGELIDTGIPGLGSVEPGEVFEIGGTKYRYVEFDSQWKTEPTEGKDAEWVWTDRWSDWVKEGDLIPVGEREVAVDQEFQIGDYTYKYVADGMETESGSETKTAVESPGEGWTKIEGSERVKDAKPNQVRVTLNDTVIEDSFGTSWEATFQLDDEATYTVEVSRHGGEWEEVTDGVSSSCAPLVTTANTCVGIEVTIDAKDTSRDWNVRADDGELIADLSLSAGETSDVIFVSYDEAPFVVEWRQDGANGDWTSFTERAYDKRWTEPEDCADVDVAAEVLTGDVCAGYDDVEVAFTNTSDVDVTIELDAAGSEGTNPPADLDPINLDPGGSQTLIFEDLQAGAYTLTWSATADDTISVAEGELSFEVDVCEPSISLTKQADETEFSFTADDEDVTYDVTYTYTVVNDGDVPLELISLIDEVTTPQVAQQIDLTDELLEQFGDGPAILEVGSQVSVQFTITYDAEVDPSVIDNTATVTGEDELGEQVTDSDDEQITSTIVAGEDHDKDPEDDPEDEPEDEPDPEDEPEDDTETEEPTDDEEEDVETEVAGVSVERPESQVAGRQLPRTGASSTMLVVMGLIAIGVGIMAVHRGEA